MDGDRLASDFEQQRERLRTLAYRMLGSATDAEDAVQEAWLRVSGADASSIDNFGGWLTTVVGRICLDVLRSRAARREQSLPETGRAESAAMRPAPSDPERDAVLADSIGLALLVVLDRLEPAERVAFVLHDMFAVPFDEIATILGRSSVAARQLASRARRRVHGQDVSRSELATHRKTVDAFLTALRAGDLEGLVAVLDPDVVVHIDKYGGAADGKPREIHGAMRWAKGAMAFGAAARGVAPVLVNGEPALIWAPHGRLARALTFVFKGDKIVSAEIFGDPARLAALDIEGLGD